MTDVRPTQSVSDHVWALVVARTRAPKSRLAGVLSPDARRELTLAMLADVLDACATSALLSGTLAVIDSLDAQQLAREHAAEVLLEPPGGLGGMNAAVQAGLDHLVQRGARSALVLPADVPLVSQRDIAALLNAAAAAGRAVIVASSADRTGTNALLLRPPGVIRPAFGPPSADRHAALGRMVGAHTVVLRALDLALDVDTPEQLFALRARAVGATAAALEQTRLSAR
jgi:2-phospho-L-lactate guanylyltransferase